jgi:hypothetical protein
VAQLEGDSLEWRSYWPGGTREYVSSGSGQSEVEQLVDIRVDSEFITSDHIVIRRLVSGKVDTRV